MSSGQATVSDHGGCAALLSAEDLPDGLVVADDQGRVITFNRMAARLTGVPADHALGKDFRDVLPLHDPEGRDWWKCTDLRGAADPRPPAGAATPDA